ncbi:MAG: hypothetical protein WCP95_02950 [Actinomycetes bacterium]
MSATARKLYDEITLPTSPPEYDGEAYSQAEEIVAAFDNADGTEYATRGAKGARSGRPNLRMVSPLRPERASRGVFALVVVGMLIVGMVVILVINTSLAQGAFTVSELQAQQAGLTQQEQALSQAVAAAAAPEALEKAARAMGMVPSQNPVFLKLPKGKILGKPTAAPGGGAAEPALKTPADATASEAVDNASVGTDLPIAPGVNYDPAAVDAAAAQAKAANGTSVPLTLTGEAATVQAPAASAAAGLALSASGGVPVQSARPIKHVDTKVTDGTKPSAAKPKGAGKRSETSLWSDSTVIDVTGPLASNDAGLVAVPVN